MLSSQWGEKSNFWLSLHLCLDARKPVIQVYDKVGLKPVSSATETSWKIEIWLEASLDIVLSNKRITKVLIRLPGCAGWSRPVLFANPGRQVFLRQGPFTSILHVHEYIYE